LGAEVDSVGKSGKQRGGAPAILGLHFAGTNRGGRKTARRGGGGERGGTGGTVKAWERVFGRRAGSGAFGRHRHGYREGRQSPMAGAQALGGGSGGGGAGRPPTHPPPPPPPPGASGVSFGGGGGGNLTPPAARGGGGQKRGPDWQAARTERLAEEAPVARRRGKKGGKTKNKKNKTKGRVFVKIGRRARRPPRIIKKTTWGSDIVAIISGPPPLIGMGAGRGFLRFRGLILVWRAHVPVFSGRTPPAAGRGNPAISHASAGPKKKRGGPGVARAQGGGPRPGRFLPRVQNSKAERIKREERPRPVSQMVG